MSELNESPDSKSEGGEIPTINWALCRMARGMLKALPPENWEGMIGNLPPEQEDIKIELLKEFGTPKEVRPSKGRKRKGS